MAPCTLGRVRSLANVAPQVMTHGDLFPGNRLVENARLVGVLDGVGFVPVHPSLDLIVAQGIPLLAL